MQLQSAELRARDPRGCESVATTPGSSVGLCDRVAAPIPTRGNRRGRIIMFRGTGVRRLPLGRRRQRSMLPAATVPPGAEVRATGSNTGISLIVSDDGNSSTCAGATTPSTCTSVVGWCIRCASREACTLPARSLEQPMNFCMSSWDGGAAVRSDPSTQPLISGSSRAHRAPCRTCSSSGPILCALELIAQTRCNIVNTPERIYWLLGFAYASWSSCISEPF